METIELVRGNLKEAMKDAGATSGNVWQIELKHIHAIYGFNVRQDSDDYKAHIESLCASIQANGFNITKPLAGYVALDKKDSVIYLTDGYSRLAAVKLANERGLQIESLPIVVSPKGTNMEDLTVALVTSNTGKPLTPFETGLVCKRLLGYGMEEKNIAVRLNLTPAYIAGLLSLIGAPKKIRDMVSAGEVSASEAISQIRKHGAEAVEKLDKGVAKAKATGKKKATGKHLDNDRSVKEYKTALRALVKYVTPYREGAGAGLLSALDRAEALLK